MTLIAETLIEEEAFIERFLPLPNLFNPHASLDFGNSGCLYETFGTELDHISSIRPDYVWTLMDSDGSLLLVSGIHFVDRLGYLVCDVPVPIGESFIVVLAEGGAA